MASFSTGRFVRNAMECIPGDSSAELSELLQTVESSGLLSKEFNHIGNDWNWPSVGVSQLSLFSSVGCLGKKPYCSPLQVSFTSSTWCYV